jgi:hypothetical protein
MQFYKITGFYPTIEFNIPYLPEYNEIFHSVGQSDSFKLNQENVENLNDNFWLKKF